MTGSLKTGREPRSTVAQRIARENRKEKSVSWKGLSYAVNIAVFPTVITQAKRHGLWTTTYAEEKKTPGEAAAPRERERE